MPLARAEFTGITVDFARFGVVGAKVWSHAAASYFGESIFFEWRYIHDALGLIADQAGWAKRHRRTGVFQKLAEAYDLDAQIVYPPPAASGVKDDVLRGMLVQTMGLMPLIEHIALRRGPALPEQRDRCAGVLMGLVETALLGLKTVPELACELDFGGNHVQVDVRSNLVRQYSTWMTNVPGLQQLHEQVLHQLAADEVTCSHLLQLLSAAPRVTKYRGDTSAILRRWQRCVLVQFNRLMSVGVEAYISSTKKTGDGRDALPRDLFARSGRRRRVDEAVRLHNLKRVDGAGGSRTTAWATVEYRGLSLDEVAKHNRLYLGDSKERFAGARAVCANWDPGTHDGESMNVLVLYDTDRDETIIAPSKVPLFLASVL